MVRAVESEKTLVLRMDDAGSCPSANEAIARALDFGLARSVGIMVPAPWFREAAELLRSFPGAHLGLHATLNAEWTEVRWGPVAGAERVPSLVEEDGTLTQFPNVLHERGFSLGEVRMELKAQLQACRAAGLRLSYLDEHMGFGWLPGVLEILSELSAKAALAFRPSYDGLPLAQSEGAPLRERLLRALEAAPPGRYLVVLHPAFDSPDTRRFWHPGLEKGQIARERDEEARLLVDPKFRDGLADLRVALARYGEPLSRGTAL
ncbi:MAG: ChbG/HpnK family deacetylase [Fimbriimonadales bacterium]